MEGFGGDIVAQVSQMVLDEQFPELGGKIHIPASNQERTESQAYYAAGLPEIKPGVFYGLTAKDLETIASE